MNNVLPGFIDSRPVNDGHGAHPMAATARSGEIANTVPSSSRRMQATSPARTFASTAASREVFSGPMP